MANSNSQQERVVSPSTLPIFAAFFTWGFGTGAQQLGRPLFAYAATGNIFLVGVLIASNAIPRIVTGPLTGYLTDRLGRKPMVILGSTIRGLTNLGQFFATDYVTFLVLELIGQVGVGMWGTSSSVLLSDVTQRSNRGRMLAVRTMSMRLGFFSGPLLGGIVAAAFGLQAVFLVNAVTKLIIVLVVWLKVSETRPEAERRPQSTQATQKRHEEEPQRRFSLEPFRNRSFLALAAATVGHTLTQYGVLQAALPVHVQTALGVDVAAVGFLMSLAAAFTFFFAYPNGMLADRFGRKASLVPGLLLLAVFAFILNFSPLYALVVLAMVVQGTGEAMTQGTTQSYAMDLAPDRGRGTFLGIWHTVQGAGAALAPLLVTGLYEYASPSTAFLFVGAMLVFAALLMLVFAKETVTRPRVP